MTTKIKKIMFNIECFLFIFSVFFQNFSIIKFEDFGISFSVIYLFIISILNFKNYYLKINKKIFMILLSFFIVVGVNVCFGVCSFKQVLRYLMMIWLAYVSYNYMKIIYLKDNQNVFWKIYRFMLMFILLYGIYEFFAVRKGLPLFLNVFNNNPSYAIRGLYDYYGGWIEKNRLYNVFYEPSAYSMFLVINFFIVLENKYISNKKVLCFLMLFNLFFTYARTGYAMLVYMSVLMFVYKKCKIRGKNIIDIIVILIPFINLFFMNLIAISQFDDISSLTRTTSALYYLKNSFDNIFSICFGYGCGSLQLLNPSEPYVEHFAHNGYVELIYQFGVLFFIYLISMIYKNSQKYDFKIRYLFLGIISVSCILAASYNIESIMILYMIVFVYCDEEYGKKKRKSNGKNRSCDNIG